MQLAIQLYTLRDLDESILETIDRVGDSSFDGVQFAGLGDASPEDVSDALEAADLAVAGAHISVDDLEETFAETIDAYDTIGCDDLVISSYERTAFEAAGTARAAGEHVSRLADRASEAGKRVHYHNHTFEFADLDGRSAFDVFAEAASGVGLEIDTGLANHGGADPIALLERYADRIDFVHLTDSRPGPSDTRHMDLGTGEVDLEGCVKACSQADVDWLIFEHGLSDDALASMTGAEQWLQAASTGD